jgi:UPF0716 family protein affecting phage T7 exclusion
MSLKDLLGYFFCCAAIVLFIATCFTSLGWGWAVLAVFLFFVGWCLLRSERRSVAESIGDVVETVVDAVDLD